jgi:hypothetical protein
MTIQYLTEVYRLNRGLLIAGLIAILFLLFLAWFVPWFEDKYSIRTAENSHLTSIERGGA